MSLAETEWALTTLMMTSTGGKKRVIHQTGFGQSMASRCPPNLSEKRILTCLKNSGIHDRLNNNFIYFSHFQYVSIYQHLLAYLLIVGPRKCLPRLPIYRLNSPVHCPLLGNLGTDGTVCYDRDLSGNHTLFFSIKGEEVEARGLIKIYTFWSSMTMKILADEILIVKILEGKQETANLQLRFHISAQLENVF